MNLLTQYNRDKFRVGYSIFADFCKIVNGMVDRKPHGWEPVSIVLVQDTVSIKSSRS